MGFIGHVMSFSEQGDTDTLTEALGILKYPLAIAAKSSQIKTWLEKLRTHLLSAVSLVHCRNHS
jgi:hypothetical protein